jgi:hypothetical protein
MTTDKYELRRMPAARHPERSEGSTLSANVRPLPWILRTASAVAEAMADRQDDGEGRYVPIRAPSRFFAVEKLPFSK